MDKNELLVQKVFDNIADAQTRYCSQILRIRIWHQIVKSQFGSPEYHRGKDTHQRVNCKLSGVVFPVLDFVIEDKLLVQNILDDETGKCPKEHGDIECTCA